MVCNQVRPGERWGNASNWRGDHSKPNINDADPISKLGTQCGGLALGDGPAIESHTDKIEVRNVTIERCGTYVSWVANRKNKNGTSMNV
jgi:hypothetical protein